MQDESIQPESSPLDRYDASTRQAIEELMRAKAIDPDLYGIALWSGGFLGVHRMLIDSPFTAFAQFTLVVLGAALGVRGGLALSIDDITLGVAALLIAFAWWMFDVATVKRTVLRAQFKREQVLLAKVDTALGGPSASPQDDG